MLKPRFTCVCTSVVADLIGSFTERANSRTHVFACARLALLEKRSGGDGVIKAGIEKNTPESKQRELRRNK